MLRSVPNEEIDRLERVVNAIDGTTAPSERGRGKGVRGPMKQETKDKIAAARKKAWAEAKSGKKAK